jgi:type I restriction enzyme S subunit
VTRLRFVADFNPSKQEAAALLPDTEVSFLPMEAIGDDGSLRLETTRPLASVEQGYTYFRDGDVVIAKITPCFENGKGALITGLIGGVGFGTTELIVVRPKEHQTLGSFLHWLFVSPDFRNTATASMYGAGGQKRVPDAVVRDFVLALPPLAEQYAIAAFLDRETGKIDALVAEQERLIALLKEKRQAVISQAVTKGLDPNVPMKDSGVAWLGQVPAHWEVTRLGRVTATKCDGPFGSGLKSEHYTECGVRVIRLQNIRMGHFDDTDAAFIDEEYFRVSLPGHDVQEGDLLIAGLGDDRNIVGRCCVAPAGVEPAMVKADCFRFRLFTQHALPAFMAMQLTAGSQFDAGMMSSGSTRSRIPLSVMATRSVALPPLAEQQELVEEIEARSRDFDTLTNEAHSAIAILRERRAALISAAVTGKIDVRGLVPPAEAAAA